MHDNYLNTEEAAPEDPTKQFWHIHWLVFSLICGTPDRSDSCRDVSPSSHNVHGNRGQIPCVSVTEQHRLSLTDQTDLLEDELQPVVYFILCSTSQNCISCRTQLYLSVGIRRAKCLNCVKKVFVLDLETIKQVLLFDRQSFQWIVKLWIKHENQKGLHVQDLKKKKIPPKT